MKILTQLAIILSISLTGEVLSAVLPLPIPASIYGIVILFALLVWRGIVISLGAKDKFGMLLGTGLSVQV